MNTQTNRLPAVAQVLEAIPSASSTGKFETLGSNFSNETRICEAACVLLYLQVSHIPKRTLINECKKHRLPSVVRVQVATLSATCTGKNRAQGSIFSHELRFSEAAGVPYYLQGSHILKRTLINEYKKHRLPAVVRVQVATLLATCTGENRDQGSIFSHELRLACSDPKKLDFFETT